MRVRLHESPAAAISVEPLIRALDIEIVERLSTLPKHGTAGTPGIPPDFVLWNLSDDPEVSGRELRFLLGDPDLHRIPTLVALPPSQLGLELSAMRGGCEAVIHSPVTLASIANALSSIAVPQATSLSARLDQPTTLVSIDDAALADEIVVGLRKEGHVVYAPDKDHAGDVARRVGLDLAVVDAVEKGETLVSLQPDAGIVFIATDQDESDLGTRIDVTSGTDGILRCCRAELRSQRDRQRSRALADRIASRQRELQRVNQTLRRINRAFHEANTRLEIQGHRKDEMVGIAAHELKSPLAAMGGALDLLFGRSERFEEDDRQLLRLVQRNNKRMIKLVNDILVLARLDAGAIEPRYESLTLPPLIDQAVTTVAVHARDRGIRFDIDAAEPDRPMDVDAERVVQMLINLLDNAIKFSPAGGIVRVSVRFVRHRVHVVVSDAGPGVAEAQRERVFERFHHDSRGAVHAAGSGLGLTITLALARLHGGNVTVGEGADGGAQFTITLPVSRGRETR